MALETLQNACNDFRTHMEHRGDDYPFGDQLAELRAVALLFAADVEEHFKLAQAAALVDKIDMGTAQSPLGPEQRLIYVWPKPADDTDA